MLLVLCLSLLGSAAVHSAAVTSSPRLINEAHLLPPHNLSTNAFDIPPSLNDSHTLPFIDPRFTYSVKFANLFLDKRSASINALLALADLSRQGWTSRLTWEEQYQFTSYGNVVIRIHARQNPSTLQYRHAIWGLYHTIRETSANKFKACVVTLYWTTHFGATSQVIGYVSIVGETSLGIDSGNATEDFPEISQELSPEPALTNRTNATYNFTSLATEITHMPNVQIKIIPLGQPLNIDAVFRILYPAVVYFASMPQRRSIDEPGFIKDDVSSTFLRWDSSYLTTQPCFEYRYAILALANVPIYMYEWNQFEEMRFIVYVDEVEVGRGWLYRRVPSSE